jgi:hypothetical protein
MSNYVKPVTLTAITPTQPEEAAERTARHLRVLAELVDLGMQLARATAARALAELAEPEAAPAAEPLPNPAAEPPSDQAAAPLSQSPAPEPPPDPAPAATPRRTSARPPGTGTTARKPTDPVLAFIRLAAAIREIITLEASLAAGPTTKHGLVSPALRADPRRAPLLEAFREVTENHPDRAAFRRETTARLDEELTADPEQTLGLPKIFFPICEEFGIEIDYAQLRDEILGMGPETANEDFSDIEFDWEKPPKPHATDPP